MRLGSPTQNPFELFRHTIARKMIYLYKKRWSIYATPIEIIELVESNLITNYQECQYDWSLYDKKKGVCNSRWFYFDLK